MCSFLLEEGVLGVLRGLTLFLITVQAKHDDQELE